MSDTTITIPVQALMRVQPDGSIKMVKEESEFVTVEASVIAKFFIDAFRRGLIPGNQNETV